MIKAIIRFSVRQKLIITIFLLVLIGSGISALRQLSIDAVPDITNNQVQVVTVSGSLAPQEVEQFITYPVEVAMANIPNVIEIRSLSRFGLSVVTIVFKDHIEVLKARQFVKEQIDVARQEIPPHLGVPELMPITTGLGEIYQYVLEVEKGYEAQFNAMELRTIQDWIVKRQLAGIPGIIEVSSFGGYLKQYEVAVDPVLLRSQGIALVEIFEALSQNNQNTGGSYIEKGHNAFYIRTEGLLENISDIESIVVSNKGTKPILIKDIAAVRFGAPKRFGAMTMDGLGEAVGGITLMLKGANSLEAIRNVKERILSVQESLPEGVNLVPYLDRSQLIAKTTHTVRKNLLEGGIIVILVLILLLGNWRAGIIVASVIPLAMLFAIILMNLLGVSANLMSLGAIDFGIVVDGAVIIVEGILFALSSQHIHQQLTQSQMDEIVIEESAKLFKSAIFGVFIILVVFIPIMTLSGIEGKMFRPMALTFSFAVLGALLLSLTYVPMLASMALKKKQSHEKSLSDKFMDWLKSIYQKVLRWVLKVPTLIMGAAVAIFIGLILLFKTLGAEFIPTLEEGDLAMQMAIPPGSSLEESIRSSTLAEQVLLDKFPEVTHVVSKIGTAEVPTDPMAIEDADIMIILKDKKEWTSASTREDLVDKMKKELAVILGPSFEFTQPIQLRFNELMSGSKADIAVKIFGENTEELARLGNLAAKIITDIPGAADVKLEQTEGLPQLKIVFDRQKIAEYGLNIEQLNQIIRTAYAGEVAGVIFENERKFDLVVRLNQNARSDVNLDELFVQLDEEHSIPMSELASLKFTEGPMQIARENTRRRISIGVNVRERDVASLVADIQAALKAKLKLPPGYYFSYGGQFENLEKAQSRLLLAVPVALLLIFFLLFFTFGKIKDALMIFTAVPLSAIGGIAALWLRGMPFSISAGVGFIALFGVAVLNGIVLISYFKRLQMEEEGKDLRSVILEGSLARLRPVLMTAIVAALGFLPMALSTSNGAEVQKPLASVVIGGLISATILTLLVLPALYYRLNKRSWANKGLVMILLLVGFSLIDLRAQVVFSVESAIDSATILHPDLRNAALKTRVAELLSDQARVIPPANFNLSLGQFNTREVDFNFSATQSLGNIAADRERKKLAQALTIQSQRKNELIEHRIIHQVEKSWHQWNFQALKMRKLIALEANYRSLEEKAELQLNQGQINRLEKSLIVNRLLQLQQQIGQTQMDLLEAKAALMQDAWLKSEPLEPDTSWTALDFPFSTAPNSLLTAVMAQSVEVTKSERSISEKAFAPVWSFSAFHQSILPFYPLFGVGFGTQIPLFRKSTKAKIQSLRFQQLIAQNELQAEQQIINTQIQKQLAVVQNFSNLLNSSGQQLLTQAEELKRLALQQLAAGETSYFQYLQALDLAMQNELEWLNLLNNYNQAVLDYNYLTQ